jgi:hypothetical protein
MFEKCVIIKAEDFVTCVKIESFSPKNNIIVTEIDGHIKDHSFKKFIREIVVDDKMRIYEYKSHSIVHMFEFATWKSQEKRFGDIFNHYDGEILAKEDSKIWDFIQGTDDDEVMKGKIITEDDDDDSDDEN